MLHSNHKYTFGFSFPIAKCKNTISGNLRIINCWQYDVHIAELNSVSIFLLTFIGNHHILIHMSHLPWF